MYKLKDAVWHNKDTQDEWVEFGYGITADYMNIKLVKLGFLLKDSRGAKRGKVTEYVCGYYPSVSSALRKIYQSEVGFHGVEDLTKANSHILQTIEACADSLGKLNCMRVQDLEKLIGG